MQGQGLQHSVEGPVTPKDEGLIFGGDKFQFSRGVGYQNVNYRRFQFELNAGICQFSKRGFKADNAQPGGYIQKAGLWTVSP